MEGNGTEAGRPAPAGTERELTVEDEVASDQTPPMRSPEERIRCIQRHQLEVRKKQPRQREQ